MLRTITWWLWLRSRSATKQKVGGFISSILGQINHQSLQFECERCRKDAGMNLWVSESCCIKCFE